MGEIILGSWIEYRSASFGHLLMIAIIVMGITSGFAHAVPVPKLKPSSSADPSVSQSKTTSLARDGGEDKKSLPVAMRFVVDKSGILARENEYKLTKALSKLYANYGVHLVIFNTPSLQGYTIDQFTQAVSNRWSIASSANKPGVLFVIASNERQIKIKVGPGLEEWIPNEMVDFFIQRSMIPAFEQAEWDRGIMQGISGMIIALARDKPLTMAELNKISTRGSGVIAGEQTGEQTGEQAGNGSGERSRTLQANIQSSSRVSSPATSRTPRSQVSAELVREAGYEEARVSEAGEKGDLLIRYLLFAPLILACLFALGFFAFWYRGRRFTQFAPEVSSG